MNPGIHGCAQRGNPSTFMSIHTLCAFVFGALITLSLQASAVIQSLFPGQVPAQVGCRRPDEGAGSPFPPRGGGAPERRQRIGLRSSFQERARLPRFLGRNRSDGGLNKPTGGIGQAHNDDETFTVATIHLHFDGVRFNHIDSRRAGAGDYDGLSPKSWVIHNL